MSKPPKKETDAVNAVLTDDNLRDALQKNDSVTVINILKNTYKITFSDETSAAKIIKSQDWTSLNQLESLLGRSDKMG
jgi:hypothetical protein